MLFEDKKLEEHIKQIKKELDEFKQMTDIVLKYFKPKSLSETIAIVNNQYYVDFINYLKQIRHYDDESDYYYTIEDILFNYLTNQKDAVEIQILDVYPKELIESIDGELFDIYILEENNQFYLLTSNMGQGYKIHQFQKFEIKSTEMQLTYNFSKEYKQLKEKYDKKMKEHFMLELLQALKQHINNNYEKVVKTTESSVYFERTKANDVKEIFRINFVDDNIKYYCVNHQATVDTIKNIEPDDEISFNNTEDIINYLYE